MPLEIGGGRTIFRTAATKFGDIHLISAVIWRQGETSRLQNELVGALLLSQTFFKVFTVATISSSGLVLASDPLTSPLWPKFPFAIASDEHGFMCSCFLWVKQNITIYLGINFYQGSANISA